ncbi:MAG: type II toxin-antitoxin system Phd/YefM family antitoxin [Methylobacter sp.]
MRAMSLTEAKVHLGELPNAVDVSKEIIIARHDRPIARVSSPEKLKQPLPLGRLAALRNTLPAWTEPGVSLVQQLRELE